MNVQIPLSVDPSSQLGLNLNFLQSIRGQWLNIGPSTSDHGFVNEANSCLGDMVSHILNNDEQQAKNIYDAEIDTIKQNRINAFYDWEISIRDSINDAGKFTPVP